MSALRHGASEPHAGMRTHSFNQPVPIASYLIAIVVGDLASRQIGPRSHVWSEPEFVEQAAYEFAEVRMDNPSKFLISQQDNKYKFYENKPVQ